MMKANAIKDVVIVGGGFAGLETAARLRDQLQERVRVRVTVVSDQDQFVFRPYLSYVPFGLTPELLRIDLDAHTRARGMQFVRGRVEVIRPEQNELLMEEGRLHYDHLFLAPGARMTAGAMPGLREHAYVLSRESDLLLLRAGLERLLVEPQDGRRRRILLLVPPDASWPWPLYEMAFMLETWLQRNRVRPQVELLFVTPEDTYLEVLGDRLHTHMAIAFLQREIEALMQADVGQVEAGAVILTDGRTLPYDLLITAPAYAPVMPWDPLPVDADGFILVEEASRQVIGFPNIYAVGDVSSFPVKQAFLALLQADAAVEHLAAQTFQVEPAFGFEPISTWVVEQFDQAFFAVIPLGRRGGTEGAGPSAPEVGYLPAGQLTRILHTTSYLPRQGDTSNPLYAGLLWKGTELGLQVLGRLRQ